MPQPTRSAPGGFRNPGETRPVQLELELELADGGATLTQLPDGRGYVREATAGQAAKEFILKS